MKRTAQKSKTKSDLENLYRDKFFQITIDLYGVDVLLYCGKQEKLIESIKRSILSLYKEDGKQIIQKLYNYVGSDDNTVPYWCMDLTALKEHNNVIFICCEEIDPYDVDDECLLSHECLHAAIYIHNFIGIKDDKYGFESLAYVHEYILSAFLKALRKQRKKIQNDKNKDNG